MNMMSRKELEQAFGVFSHASSDLESAYASLESRVRDLTEALEAERAERKEREQERNRIARRFDCLIDALPGAVVVLDSERKVHQCNAGARNIFGDQIEGKRWSQVAEDQLQANRYGAEFTGPDGRRLSLASQSLAPDPGEVLLFTDVTESRAIEALSEQHERLAAMGEMAASLAHQIRTPLASALLYASSAKQAELGDIERAQMLGKLVGRLHDLDRLINDMLLFARGAGPVIRGIPVAEIMHIALAAVRPGMTGEQQLHIDQVPPELQVTGSEQALAGALTNLINNALEAGGEKAKVWLDAHSNLEGGVDIRVTDNGPGVAPGDELKVFEPFVSGRPGGTGLGLAVVRSVAREHGGDSWVETSADGGACFVLRLPQVAANPAGRTEVAA